MMMDSLLTTAFVLVVGIGWDFFSSLAHILFRLNEISREFDVRALIDVSHGAAELGRTRREREGENLLS